MQRPIFSEKKALLCLFNWIYKALPCSPTLLLWTARRYRVGWGGYQQKHWMKRFCYFYVPALWKPCMAVLTSPPPLQNVTRHCNHFCHRFSWKLHVSQEIAHTSKPILLMALFLPYLLFLLFIGQSVYMFPCPYRASQSACSLACLEFSLAYWSISRTKDSLLADFGFHLQRIPRWPARSRAAVGLQTEGSEIKQRSGDMVTLEKEPESTAPHGMPFANEGGRGWATLSRGLFHSSCQSNQACVSHLSSYNSAQGIFASLLHKSPKALHIRSLSFLILQKGSYFSPMQPVILCPLEKWRYVYICVHSELLQSLNEQARIPFKLTSGNAN